MFFDWHFFRSLSIQLINSNGISIILVYLIKKITDFKYYFFEKNKKMINKPFIKRFFYLCRIENCYVLSKLPFNYLSG